jgi:hypothetical protein
MFRKFLLLFIDCIIVLVEWVVELTLLIKDYGVRVWKNNGVRRWVFEVIDDVDDRFRSFVKYLEEIQLRLQCRIAYANIAKPMKHRYRELSGRRLL